MCRRRVRRVEPKKAPAFMMPHASPGVQCVPHQASWLSALLARSDAQ